MSPYFGSDINSYFRTVWIFLFILSDSKIRGNVWLDAGEGKMLIITQLSRSQF